MNRRETTNILDIIKFQTPYFTYDNAKLEEWHKTLKYYEYEDVLNKTNEALGKAEFQGAKYPSAQYLVQNLIKVTETTDLNSYQVYCPICGRRFNGYYAQVEHFDRCSSVDYVIREYKRWYPDKPQPSKRELFEMSDSEFRIRYLKLLNHIYKNTTSKDEKETIAKILNLE